MGDQVAKLYVDVNNKLVYSYDKCFNLYSDYVEVAVPMCLSNGSNKKYFLSLLF